MKCKAITEAGTRCSRNAVIEGLCTQHYNMLGKNKSVYDEVKDNKNEEKIISSNEYYINDLPVDVIQYTINGYLDYVDDIPNLEKLLDGLKLTREPHITVEEEYNPKTRKIIKRTTYLDEKKIMNEIWFDNGNIKHRFNFNYNEELEGTQYIWWGSGFKLSEENYKNGQLDGAQYEWDKNGEKISVFNYKNGKIDGKQYSWYPNGNEESIQTYINGERWGKQYVFFENGNQKGIFNYVDGKMQGNQYNYDEDSDWPSSSYYEEGILVGSFD